MASRHEQQLNTCRARWDQRWIDLAAYCLQTCRPFAWIYHADASPCGILPQTEISSTASCRRLIVQSHSLCPCQHATATPPVSITASVLAIQDPWGHLASEEMLRWIADIESHSSTFKGPQETFDTSSRPPIMEKVLVDPFEAAAAAKAASRAWQSATAPVVFPPPFLFPATAYGQPSSGRSTSYASSMAASSSKSSLCSVFKPLAGIPRLVQTAKFSSLVQNLPPGLRPLSLEPNVAGPSPYTNLLKYPQSGVLRAGKGGLRCRSSSSSGSSNSHFPAHHQEQERRRRHIVARRASEDDVGDKLVSQTTRSVTTSTSTRIASNVPGGERGMSGGTRRGRERLSNRGSTSEDIGISAPATILPGGPWEDISLGWGDGASRARQTLLAQYGEEGEYEYEYDMCN